MPLFIDLVLALTLLLIIAGMIASGVGGLSTAPVHRRGARARLPEPPTAV
jgi:hypothetical protein